MLKENITKNLCEKRKRKKAQGIKKAQKAFRDAVMRGEALPVRGGQKFKGKRFVKQISAN